MKKALVSPLQDIDKIYDLAEDYIANSPDFTFEVLRQLAEEESLATTESDPHKYQAEVRQLLKIELRKLY